MFLLNIEFLEELRDGTGPDMVIASDKLILFMGRAEFFISFVLSDRWNSSLPNSRLLSSMM
jgi:hypothetical protein